MDCLLKRDIGLGEYSTSGEAPRGNLSFAEAAAMRTTLNQVLTGTAYIRKRAVQSQSFFLVNKICMF